jgi:hypothetical protein
MDGHDLDHRQLAEFLAGTLEPAAAPRWDEHLLECELCWRAVREDRAGRRAAQLLREPAPPGLVDQIAFAVEVAATGGSAGRHRTRSATRSQQQTPRMRLAWRQVAGASMLAVALAAALVLALLPGGRQTRSVPTAVAAVARYAQALPPPSGEHPQPGWPPAPVAVGRPVTLVAGGQRIVMRTWRVSGTEAVVAISSAPFPMPPRAAAGSGAAMEWTMRLGRLGLYCVNGSRSELVVAPIPTPELTDLAARLSPG